MRPGLMDWLELARESLRAENVRAQIAARFPGCFGIGNAMARNDAEQALDARFATIRRAQVAKGCPTS
ncbi:MAG TPA: hypothetical protein DF715_09005 [Oceanicaulis sp.]|nr:hypothetical protein [Oceanicaulis sp.]